ncbi:MAG TPA: antitoxin MazE5 [Iamia sp.]
MARVRISTTVDEELLGAARRIHDGSTDAVMVEEALRLLLAQHRRAEIDAQYAAAYEAHPFDEPDEWGDLASWLDAAQRAR